MAKKRQYHALMNTEWSVAGITPVGSPDRAERAIFGVILGVFDQFGPFL